MLLFRGFGCKITKVIPFCEIIPNLFPEAIHKTFFMTKKLLFFFQKFLFWSTFRIIENVYMSDI